MHPYSFTVLLAFPLACYYHVQKSFWSTVEHDCAKTFVVKEDEGVFLEEIFDELIVDEVSTIETGHDSVWNSTGSYLWAFWEQCIEGSSQLQCTFEDQLLKPVARFFDADLQGAAGIAITCLVLLDSLIFLGTFLYIISALSRKLLTSLSGKKALVTRSWVGGVRIGLHFVRKVSEFNLWCDDTWDGMKTKLSNVLRRLRIKTNQLADQEILETVSETDSDHEFFSQCSSYNMEHVNSVPEESEPKMILNCSNIEEEITSALNEVSVAEIVGNSGDANVDDHKSLDSSEKENNNVTEQVADDSKVVAEILENACSMVDVDAYVESMDIIAPPLTGKELVDEDDASTENMHTDDVVEEVEVGTEVNIDMTDDTSAIDVDAAENETNTEPDVEDAYIVKEDFSLPNDDVIADASDDRARSVSNENILDNFSEESGKVEAVIDSSEAIIDPHEAIIDPSDTIIDPSEAIIDSSNTNNEPSEINNDPFEANVSTNDEDLSKEVDAVSEEYADQVYDVMGDNSVIIETGKSGEESINDNCDTAESEVGELEVSVAIEPVTEDIKVAAVAVLAEEISNDVSDHAVHSSGTSDTGVENLDQPAKEDDLIHIETKIENVEDRVILTGMAPGEKETDNFDSGLADSLEVTASSDAVDETDSFVSAEVIVEEDVDAMADPYVTPYTENDNVVETDVNSEVASPSVYFADGSVEKIVRIISSPSLESSTDYLNCTSGGGAVRAKETPTETSLLTVRSILKKDSPVESDTSAAEESLETSKHSLESDNDEDKPDSPSASTNALYRPLSVSRLDFHVDSVDIVRGVKLARDAPELLNVTPTLDVGEALANDSGIMTSTPRDSNVINLPPFEPETNKLRRFLFEKHQEVEQVGISFDTSTDEPLDMLGRYEDFRREQTHAFVSLLRDNVWRKSTMIG